MINEYLQKYILKKRNSKIWYEKGMYYQSLYKGPLILAH